MIIGIIGAMKEEIEDLKQNIQDMKIEKSISNTYYLGKIGNHDIILCQSGIGKVCAASQTTALIEKFKVEAVINLGIAGGIGDEIKICDTVVSTATVQYDFDITDFGYKLGQVPDYDEQFTASEKLIKHALDLKDKYKDITTLTSGLIVSGDRFVSSMDLVNSIKKSFPAARAVEMEGAAVGQVCNRYKIPYLVLRTISDKADSNSPKDSMDNAKQAISAGSKICIDIIKSL